MLLVMEIFASRIHAGLGMVVFAVILESSEGFVVFPMWDERSFAPVKFFDVVVDFQPITGCTILVEFFKMF